MPDEATERYRSRLQGELDAAALYRALAETEEDPSLRLAYARLAEVEEAHAALWRGQLGRMGVHGTPAEPSARARFVAWLGRRFGSQWILPAVRRLQQRPAPAHGEGPEGTHRTPIRAIAASIPGGVSGAALAQLEGRYTTGGNALRAAVLGANDGLVSNLSLVMGVAGAAADNRTLVLAGLAGLVAGACSMAMGEWLSVTSARELNQRQIDMEAKRVARSPEEVRAEIVLIYKSKGLDATQAGALADRLLADRDAAVETLAREELSIDPAELGGSAWVAAIASFALFAIGAIFPVLPWFWLAGDRAVVTSLAVGTVALAGIGAATARFTGRGFLVSAVRQVAIGLAAAAITYGVGRVVGVTIGG